MTNILFIGNSFTYFHHMPKILEALAESAGEALRTDAVTKGGWDLIRFSDEKDEYGRAVEEALCGETKYDFIFLQDQSKAPIVRYADFHTGALKLVKKIAAEQRGATVVFYATWGYREGFSELIELGMTTAEMAYALLSAYSRAADETLSLLSYVGLAFVEAERLGYEVHHTDKRHSSYLGSYLAAATHLFTLFPELTPEQVTFSGDLDQGTAKVLLAVAKKAAADTDSLLPDDVRATYQL